MTSELLRPADGAGYDESQIQVLEGMEAVRRRPGMYIGPTDINGLHTMVREVVDNSVDEVMAGRATSVEVTIHRDGSVTVADDGYGIPTGPHPKLKVSTLQVVMTVLHAGGKFDNQSYKVSSGLHGVGVSAVNALSAYMRVDVHNARDGFHYFQEYRCGAPQAEVQKVGPTTRRGTITRFVPDTTIIQTLDYHFKTLAQRFREMSYLNKGLRFKFVDERDDNELNFYFEGGIRSYVRHLNKDKNALHKQPFYVERTIDDVAVEVALQYTESFDTDSVYAFANGINNTDGGAHVAGFRSALTRVINAYARNKGFLKENEGNLTGDDVREGLTAVISVKLKDPQFSSQTKEKLVSPNATGAVNTVFGDAFSAWLEENPQEARRIIEKCISAARTRIAVQKVRETARKSAMEGFSLPGKLADCSDTNPARSELFVVEGDSAGGCFAGDTRVALADGRALCFRELVAEQAEGKEHFCYTIRHDGTIGVERAIHARITRHNAEVVQITLDNGETITCTPDHRFMLRDGSYKAAVSLTPDDSLMPWYCDDDETRAHDAVRTHNHRVVSVERLVDRVDVYDLEVPNTHNFALASGVFVHNSAKQGRDRRYQAILPLRGKILNVEKSRLDKMLSNNEVKALITAIGAGVGEQFDPAKLRYHRVVLMCDADVDGSHIRTLLLTFFFRYMRQIITNGHLYLAQPPLFRVKHGKTEKYVFSEQERDQYIAGLSASERNRLEIQRYKGLGEMNAEQLWETTMNPVNRLLLQVTLEDAQQADETFTMLMGDLVPPRKRFIQTHALEVKNLDI